MKSTKVNAGLSISQNFNKITLDIVDEPVEYEDREQLKREIRGLFTFIRDEVFFQFEKLAEKLKAEKEE